MGLPKLVLSLSINSGDESFCVMLIQRSYTHVHRYPVPCGCRCVRLTACADKNNTARMKYNRSRMKYNRAEIDGRVKSVLFVRRVNVCAHAAAAAAAAE